MRVGGEGLPEVGDGITLRDDRSQSVPRIALEVMVAVLFLVACGRDGGDDRRPEPEHTGTRESDTATSAAPVDLDADGWDNASDCDDGDPAVTDLGGATVLVGDLGASAISSVCLAGHPVCVTGDLILVERDDGSLPSLAALSCLVGVAGDLAVSGAVTADDTSYSYYQNYGLCAVRDHHQASDLAGLQGLVRVGGDLALECVGVGSLAGLSALREVGGVLRIDDLDRLREVEGLEQLSSVGDLEITENDDLASTVGLSGLSVVEGYVVVARNPVLADLGGLSGVAEVPGSVRLEGNRLRSLAGLGRLARVGRNLAISEGPDLPSLHGLEALSEIGGDLEIGGDTPLTGLDGLARVGGSLVLPGTSNRATARDTYCQGFLRQGEIAPGRRISFEGLGALASIGGDLRVGHEQVSIDKGQTDFLFYGSPGLASFAGAERLGSVGGSLVVLGQPSLGSMGGLDALATVGGLVLRGNPVLMDLDGLGALSEVGGGVEITWNGSLTDAAADAMVAGVETIAGNVVVCGNGP